LRVAETPYSWAVQLRNRRYDRNGDVIHRLDVPVISVGNLTLGGTGKTPMVAWLAKWFQQAGRRPAIVSRGYRSGLQEVNDEALELAQRLPDVPHVQNRDRVLAGRQAVARHGSDIIILDDAFQHRRLARDLDVVLMDATEPFGFEHVFPRGTLREPLCGLARADVVALSRANLLDAPQRSMIRQRVEQLAPTAQWMEIVQTPRHLLNCSLRTRPLDALRGARIAAFCGIGNPAAFRQTLQQCGFDLAVFRPFADHHAFTRRDAELIAESATAAEATAIICTHKDLVKFAEDQLDEIPLWALAIETEFLTGQAELVAVLQSFVDRPTVAGC
jgi:tetraacyldisaccharide 4'-kinase